MKKLERPAKILCGFLCVICTLVVLSFNAHAGAASSDSLCVFFDDTTRSIYLELRADYIIGGALPATICNIEPETKYRLRTFGSGLEKRIGKFSISSDGIPSAGGIRFSAALRNLIPGVGSVHMEQKAAGVTDLIEIAGSAIWLYNEERSYQNLNNRYSILLKEYESSDSQAEKLELAQEVYIAASEVNVQNSYRKRLLFVTLYMYGYQIIDPWIISPPPGTSVGAGGNVIAVKRHRSSTTKAFMQSLLRPGRGQFYQRKTGRGALMSLSSVSALLIGLDYQNRYDQEARKYEIAVDAFQNADTIEEKQYLAAEADKKWDDVEKQKRRRNISFAVFAGIWGWSLIDTFFPLEETQTSSFYSLDVSPGGLAFVVRF
jgi:hypothetical protein